MPPKKGKGKETDEGLVRSDNCIFHPESWKRMRTRFNETSGRNMEVQHLKNHLKVMKRNYVLVTSLLNKSGWGWDPMKYTPVAPDLSMWDEVIAADHNITKIRDKSFPYHEDFGLLFGRNIASGRKAVSSRNPLPLEEGSDSSDDMTTENQATTETLETQPTTDTQTQQQTTSSGKRYREGSTPSTARKKKTKDDTLMLLAEQGSERLQLIREIAVQGKKSNPMAGAEECLAILDEKIPNIGGEIRLSIARTLIEVEEQWLFRQCLDDNMLQAWISDALKKHPPRSRTSTLNFTRDSPTMPFMPNPMSMQSNIAYGYDFQTQYTQVGCTSGYIPKPPPNTRQGAGQAFRPFFPPRAEVRSPSSDDAEGN